MITINADVVLANILIDRESVSLAALHDIVNKIYKKTKGLYLDCCMSTILWAVNDQRPDLFEWVYGTINRRQELEEKYVHTMFNWRVPKGMRNAFMGACRAKVGKEVK